MVKHRKGVWIPVVSFGLACILALTAGPSRSEALRPAIDPTGGEATCNVVLAVDSGTAHPPVGAFIGVNLGAGVTVWPAAPAVPRVGYIIDNTVGVPGGYNMEARMLPVPPGPGAAQFLLRYDASMDVSGCTSGEEISIKLEQFVVLTELTNANAPEFGMILTRHTLSSDIAPGAGVPHIDTLFVFGIFMGPGIGPIPADGFTIDGAVENNWTIGPELPFSGEADVLATLSVKYAGPFVGGINGQLTAAPVVCSNE